MPRFGAYVVPYLKVLAGAGHYILLPVLTTTQRDALSASAGYLIYNSTTGQAEEYTGSAWRSVGQGVLTTHEALATGIHGVGAGSIVGTTLTQTLTGKTLTSPTLQGTVGAGTGLTMPAFTAGGDVTFGVSRLKFTNFTFKDDANWLIVNDAADVATAPIRASVFYFDTALGAVGGTGGLQTQAADNAYVTLSARDAGVGFAEIARLVSAADPYFQMTLAMRLLPIATASLPAAPVEGMLAYDDTANKLKVYNGTAWETVTSS